MTKLNLAELDKLERGIPYLQGHWCIKQEQVDYLSEQLRPLLNLVARMGEALRQAWPCEGVGKGECNEPTVWEWSDEDGVEYCCEKHKNYHFYAHGPSPHEPGIIVTQALADYQRAKENK